MVWDGLYNVLSTNIDWLEVPLDLALVLHGGGGQPQLTGPAVHAGVLLLATENNAAVRNAWWQINNQLIGQLQRRLFHVSG